jgi:hypothetical protein
MANTPFKAFAKPQHWTAVALIVTALIAIDCAHSQAATEEIPMSIVMQTIRDYGRGHVPASNLHAVMLPELPPTTPARRLENSDAFHAMLAGQLQQGEFAMLEMTAGVARTEQPKFAGGVWMLYEFYDGLGRPIAIAAPADWDSQIAAVKKWIAAYPESATPRIVLAKVCIERGWQARGSGYANSVNDSGWGTFFENIATAKSILLEAAKLKEKCPYWYEAMQAVALAEGWDKAQARELFDQASAFEPAYYHYYREYANFLLPKWYGEDGETQAFADEVLKRVSEPDAFIIYYEIAGLMACQCDKDRDSLDGISWPKVKVGYAALVRRNGTSSLKVNRFAYMTFVANDKPAAHDPFAEIGDSWNHQVWRNQLNFETARAWALNPD